MRRPEVTRPWYASAYSGLFSRCGPVPRRPHDPDVYAWSGTLPCWGPLGSDLATGGVGWNAAAAEGAGVGETIERWLPQPLPQDQGIESTYDSWPLDEPAIEPERWVLFHPQQYALAGFPFVPFTRVTVRRWVCCRELRGGEPWWVPEDFVFLAPRPGCGPQLGPVISTGLSCGRLGDPVLVRGLQEVIERDALVGAWWGRYPLEEHDPERVLGLFHPSLPPRLRRPNLRYRCYRVVTPYSGHVTVVTLEGEDREGFCFSAGSACRATRAASWEKAVLEAIQGRHYVRYLKARLGEENRSFDVPTDFADHAVYYSLYPERRDLTLLSHATASTSDRDEANVEDCQALAERLGADRLVLFRHLTPPPLAAEGLGWVVVRVLVPGLQPLHGHHGFPFLGGPLWAPRGIDDWGQMLPHPFL
jgi:ribosomal protein S12 methylthiotransferase accessory factor